MNNAIDSDLSGEKGIAGQLCTFLQENVLAPEIEISADTELSTIGVDSYSLMEMILFIERRYGLVLPPESLTPENIATVASLSHYCAGRLRQSDA